MTRRIGPGLIALWLLLSLPFNLAVLKELIRAAFWAAAGLYAGLDRWLWTQYLLATIFILWTAALLVWPAKLGRTLTVTVLTGSCAAMAGLILAELPNRNLPPVQGAVAGAIVALNLICLRALTRRETA